MNRTEFIDILQKTLAGRLGSSSVNENIRYYQEYIDTQMRLGQSEEEVIAGLGDPRLLAKTIIEAAKNEGRSVRPEYDEVYEDGTPESSNSSAQKVYRMPGWLIALLVILVLVIILGIVGSIVTAFLPIIIPVVCVILIVRFFARRS